MEFVAFTLVESPMVLFTSLEDQIDKWNQQGKQTDSEVEKSAKEYERYGKEADELIKKKQAKDRARRK